MPASGACSVCSRVYSGGRPPKFTAPSVAHLRPVMRARELGSSSCPEPRQKSCILVGDEQQKEGKRGGAEVLDARMRQGRAAY
jgi:hypothetical protein